jgi:tetratricopeptide (TPR) repeat protein
MDWNKMFREGEQLVSERKVAEAIEHYKGIMEQAGEEQKIYYWALKHLADVVGYMGLRDYFQSIDIYQKIINEYEAEDDPLYNWCQLDISRAYLEMGLEMMENFDSMREIVGLEDEEMENYFEKLVERRNDYIEREAEVIYKGRM